MIFQAQIPLGGLPIHLVLVGNKEQGQVVFVRVAPYTGDIIDAVGTDAVWAGFGEEGFTFTLLENGIFSIGEYFRYNTVYDYKNIPLMLRWLQQQNLQQPA